MAGKGADQELFIETGKKVKAQRAKAKLSLSELSEKAGCSKQHLYHVEAGLRRLTRDLASRIAEVLEVEISTLDGPCAYCGGSGHNLREAAS